jgi:hypothetical protein
MADNPWHASEKIHAPRSRRGRPSSPPPWVAISDDRVWAWDPTAGLLALAPIEPDEHTLFFYSPWALDGRTITYLRYFDGRRNPDVPAERRFVQWDLISDERTDGPPLERWPSIDEQVYFAPDGRRLTIEFTHPTIDGPRHGRYVLTGEGAEEVLPVTDPLRLSFHGPSAHFSADGRFLALGHRAVGGPVDDWLSITDLTTGELRRHRGLCPAGSGAWSPDGSRLLVRADPHSQFAILDVVSGTTTPLRSLEMRSRSSEAAFWEEAIGWADSSRVIAYGRGGSGRLVLSVLDIDRAEQHDVLDLPVPGGGGQGFRGIFMTPAVVQADPSSITYRG